MVNIEHHMLDPHTIIIPPDRQREDMGDIAELATSIKSHKQLVPIIVDKTPEGFVLVAGGRRTAACKEAGVSVWAVVKTSDVPNHVAESIENIHRKELNWKENALATKVLYDYLTTCAQAEGRTNVTMREASSVAKIASGKVSQDLTIAKTLEENPDVIANCKTKDAAFKAIKDHAIKEAMEELRNRHTKTNYGPKANNILLLGDCVELAKTLPDRCLNGIIADPAYGIDISKTTNNQKGFSDIYSDSPDEWAKTMTNFIQAINNKLNDDAYIAMLCSVTNFMWLNSLWESIGFRMSPIPAIWYRTGVGGRANHPETSFGSVYDTLIYGFRGKQTLVKPGAQNVLVYNAVPYVDKLHPVQASLELFDEIVSRFCLPGQTVLDFMAGSGTTLISLIKKGCKPIGFELDQVRYDAAIVRITDALKAKDAGLIENVG